MIRNAEEIAIRAILSGTLGVRASLEVTGQPRASSLCSQLLLWLERVARIAGIAPFHRAILETPHRGLSREMLVEAYWRGEEASLLGWVLHLFDRPDPVSPTGSSVLFDRLRILRPDVRELIQNARPRAAHEIEEFFAFCITVRHHNEARLLDSAGRTVLERIHHARRAELGLLDACGRLDRSELQPLLNRENPDIKGLYVVRAMTAEWLFSRDE